MQFSWSAISWLRISCRQRSSDGAQRGVQGQRKAHDERSSGAARIVLAENFSAVFANDSIANAEAQARSLPDFLGGKKGIKNSFRRDNADTVVAETDFHVVGGKSGDNFDARQASGFANGVVGVVQDVEKNLLELQRIADDIRHVFAEVLDDLDTMAIQIVGA